ncbi:MAG: hypothetical protein E7585_02640 [Ruminococcaceae bacterium]|nr:hypothetical protein [Oscillospiraceae bacterium]
MYEYRPQRKNHIALFLVIGLLLLAAASFVTSAFFEAPARTIIQAVGLIAIVPMLQIAARYLITRYLYRLCPYEDGNTDIEVYAYRGGARMQLVCRVGLEEITAATPLSNANRKSPKGIHRYNYAPDIRPVGGLVLSITNGDGDCEVLLCPDERLTEILSTPYTPPVLSAEAAISETTGESSEE